MYVARLASLYDVSYNLFCSRALQIPLTDRDALSLTDPSDEVLERLSTGVGVPVEDLRGFATGRDLVPADGRNQRARGNGGRKEGI